MRADRPDRDFSSAVEPFRRELLVHCYRMLGSVHDAQDLVQDTLVRAWRAYDRYDERLGSMRTWLYRIATNACLSALRARARRPLPADVGPVFDDPDAAFAPGFEVPWLQPIPEHVLRSAGADPADLAVERAQLRLGVVAALQLLTPRQRAALVLCGALDIPAREVATMLETSTAAVNSSLQRARRTLAQVTADPHIELDAAEEQRRVADAWVAAFVTGDVAALTRLVADDVVLEMPPMRNWYRGAVHYGAFMARIYRTRGTAWRTLPIDANGQAGCAAFRCGDDGEWALHTVQLFEIADGRMTRVSVFQHSDVFALFGLPDRWVEPTG